MIQKHRPVLLFILMFALAFVTRTAAAQEGKTALNWKESGFFLELEAVDLTPAKEGEEEPKERLVGIWRTKGLAVFDNGEVATTLASGTYDFVEGVGPYTGYVVYMFTDGSTMRGVVQGKLIRDEQGAVRQEGTLSYAGGTQRFEGILGGGSFKGRNFGPVDGEWATLVEATATYMVPKP